MRIPECNREQEVVDALRSGRWANAWGEDIRRHAAECPACAEVAMFAGEFLHEKELAGENLQQPWAGLPSAGLVWWKAQLAARRAAQQRAAGPMIMVERMAYAIGALAMVALGIWQWSRLAGWLRPVTALPMARHLVDSFGGDCLHRVAQAWTVETPAMLLAACAAAILTLLILTVFVAWRED